ncbi:MAG: 2,3-bisphosphoglycerate-independent phosphoglycerate mutase [Candidatus Buchananbacteria bacterium]|nr:2,3-bisphosphoglycerate-independent phosphoglycerate mutase [Candidatus Buchananbacteria bacterium]
MTTERQKPIVLIILDGWGVAPPSKSNAISLAKTPTYNSLVKNYPAMTLQASGESVGLSWGEIGNSEVGHLNIGSGKLVYQNLPKIDKEITSGSFFSNPTLLKAMAQAKKNKKAVHLMGLFTSGGVHASINHFYALVEMCKKEKIKDVFVHAFLDGRDMPYNSGIDLIAKAQEKLKENKIGQIASISGRYYAMDRDNHWERIELAYKAIVKGESIDKFDDPIKAVQASYDKKVYDEEFVPVVITEKGQPITTVGAGDSVIFFNFRSDRARQLTKTFVLPGFEKFKRDYLNNLYFVTMTEYEKDLPVEIAFPPDLVTEPLSKVISDAKLKQLHIAETEKYAHVTFFFNGGREESYPGEDRVLIPSPRVASYDQKPVMSAKEITKKLTEVIMKSEYDFIVVNFANADMVAHTGDLKSSIKACEIVDDCLKQLTEVILGKGGIALITADHGNAEELMNMQSGKIDKEHSTYPVPFIIVGQKWEGKTAGLPDGPNSDLSLVQPSGLLSDVAPTILKLMNLEKPSDMTGKSLI